MKNIWLLRWSVSLWFALTRQRGRIFPSWTHESTLRTVFLHELMATPDKGIPLDIAAKAHCVAVIPGSRRAPSLWARSTGKA